MEIIESEAHWGQFNLEGKAEANKFVLSSFLNVWIVIARRDSESGKEFQMVGPADLNPREPKTVLTCGTQSWCATRRAESTRRNIRTNEGWQIWRGYGMERLKNKESNFEMDPSWDWKPVEVFQKGGCAGPWSGECNYPSVVCSDILCLRDRFLFEMPNRQALA